MMFPTKQQGHDAHVRGQDDALAGRDRDLCPWDQRAADSVERCLALSYQRGYSYGLQVAMQGRYGNPPTA